MTDAELTEANLAGAANWGAPSSKVITWHDPLITAAAAPGLSGLEFLRAMRDGKLPPAPIAGILDFRMIEIEEGQVVFECTPDESVYNPIGTVHGGLVCTLADTVAACAVHSTLPAGTGYTSIDLNVKLHPAGDQGQRYAASHRHGRASPAAASPSPRRRSWTAGQGRRHGDEQLPRPGAR